MTEYKRLHHILSSSLFIQRTLITAREMAPPNSWIVGGVIRDVVWSAISRRPLEASSFKDIDLVYFDKHKREKAYDIALEQKLTPQDGIPWSVKNQARMHDLQGVDPPESLEEAIMRFPETISSIAIKMGGNGEMILINCYGYDDLLSMIIRPTPFFTKHHGYSKFLQRVNEKEWLTKWPDARLAR